MVMKAELEQRRKRMVYRANYRGTKEMDWLLGKFIEARVHDFDGEELDLIDAFLLLPDPRLENWIMGRDTEIEPEFEALVARIRRFHKMGQAPE